MIGRCLAHVSLVPWSCRGGVLPNVLRVCRSCLGGVAVMFGWCLVHVWVVLGHVLLVCHSCLGGVSVMFGWCLGHVSLCLGHVSVVASCSCLGVSLMFRGCLGHVSRCLGHGLCVASVLLFWSASFFASLCVNRGIALQV